MTHLVYEGTEFPIAAELVLGRQRDCGVVIADGKASRHHARVFTKPDATVWVEDLDSANGTRVNGEEIFSPRRLVDGDRIVIGKASVVLHGQTPATTPAAGQAALPDDGKELVGTELAGYRLEAVLGAGAMGVVYSATQVAMKRAVAVKVFTAALVAREDGFAARLLAAARRSGSVQHPGIAQIHDCGEQDGRLWYSMELVSGDTLEDLIARDGRVDPGLALLVVDQAATALQAAHAKGVFHFGVTAANLMLASDGHVKLLDLGLVSVLDSARHRTRDAQTEIVGNPWYTSPERTAGKDGDARSDVYSLGCVLYHLIAGEPPFDDASPRAILEAHRDRPIPSLLERLRELALPTKLDELVHGMLSKNPAWRHASMDEMLVDLRVVRELVAAMPPRTPEKAKESVPPAPRPR
ncbi:MAG: protein kinase, partial [Planctomycetes bacterium]|nr:protein kinase [Planctomycetota bacterium]